MNVSDSTPIITEVPVSSRSPTDGVFLLATTAEDRYERRLVMKVRQITNPTCICHVLGGFRSQVVQSLCTKLPNRAVESKTGTLNKSAFPELQSWSPSNVLTVLTVLSKIVATKLGTEYHICSAFYTRPRFSSDYKLTLSPSTSMGL